MYALLYKVFKIYMSNLPITEELDFAYLLELMPPLHSVPEFAWLPELFSIIGHERLLLLCKYAGGETIQIPTLEQLSNSIEALQIWYDIHVKHSRSPIDVPIELKDTYNAIEKVYNARNC